MAVDITKNAQALQEQLSGVANGYTALGIKQLIKGAAVVTANPTDFAAVANASAVTGTATATVTGVAVGDIVLGYGVVSGLAANSYVAGCYVSATDTVRFVIAGEINSTVTTTAMTVNVIVGDVT